MSPLVQLFYKLDLIVEHKDFAAALAFLEKEEENLTEKRRVREVRTSLLLQLGRNAEAVPIALELLELNSEDSRYHTFLQRARKVDGQHDALFQLYEGELQKKFPRSQACRRIPLDFLPASDPRFATSFTSYYQRLLEKGAPSGNAMSDCCCCCQLLLKLTFVCLFSQRLVRSSRFTEMQQRWL